MSSGLRLPSLDAQALVCHDFRHPRCPPSKHNSTLFVLQPHRSLSVFDTSTHNTFSHPPPTTHLHPYQPDNTTTHQIFQNGYRGAYSLVLRERAAACDRPRAVRVLSTILDGDYSELLLTEFFILQRERYDD